MKKIRVIGIESSCDETSVSIVEKTGNKIKVLSNIVKSQIDIHKFYGGVVPELAARAHSDVIDKLIVMALKKANEKWAFFSCIRGIGSAKRSPSPFIAYLSISGPPG